MSEKSIYKSESGKKEIVALYNKALHRLNVVYRSQMVSTQFGKTHVLEIGPKDGPPIMIFQGGNAINPMVLSWFKPLLTNEFRILAPDTIGHPGLSSEKRISPLDDSFGRWVVDLLDNYDIQKAILIGPSYGAGIILRTAAYTPDRVSKAVLVVPAGIAAPSIYKILRKIVIPMIVYRFAPSKERLRKVIEPMSTEELDGFFEDATGAILRNVRLETKMPKYTTEEELKGFDAPTILFSAENDIFFPSQKINPRAENIIPNLVAIHTLAGERHVLSLHALRAINEQIVEFISN